MDTIDKLGGEDQGQTSSTWKVALASLIGTTIEWYDFFIFGTAAAIAFNVLFFPTADPVIGTLLAFSTFAVAFVARPIGGIVFGHFGDRIGRKSMLVVTLSLMGIATFLIGVLPTYETIGVWAPLLLVTLRFVQGFSLGGEYGGAVLMAVEHASSRQRGFYGSWVQMGVPTGLILANAVFLPISALPDQQFLSWGWRIPFLLSVLLVAVGLVIRLTIIESPGFRRAKETNAVTRLPIISVLRTYPKQVLLIAGAYVSAGVTFYVTGVFGLSYGTEQLGLERSTMLWLVLVSMIVTFFALPAFGSLSDRIGRKPVFLAGVAAMGLFAFPWFWLLNTKQFAAMLAGYLLIFIPYSACYGTMATFFAELFGLQVRYSGLSLGYTLGTVFGSALAPILATYLLELTGTETSIAIYMVLMAVISIISTLLLTETYQSDIDQSGLEADQP